MPSSPAPPSFGQAAPAAQDPTSSGGAADTGDDEDDEDARDSDEAPPRRTRSGAPPFGPKTPWWAEPKVSNPQQPADDATDEVEPAEEPPPAEPPRTVPTSPPDRLVAGLGVPSVDTRRAVPAEPIVEPPPSKFSDTDPDGIPILPGPSPNPPAETEPAAETDPAPETETKAETAAETGAAAEADAAAETGPAQAAVPDDGAGPADTAADDSAGPADTAREDLAVEDGDAVTTRPDGRPWDAPGARVGESALTPDAILPPGVSPTEPIAVAAAAEEGTAPIAMPAEQPAGAAPAEATVPNPVTVIAPAYHAAGTPPPEAGFPAAPAPPAAPDYGRRRLLLIGGVAGTIVLAAAAMVALAAAFGPPDEKTGGRSAETAPQDPSTSPTPSSPPSTGAATPPVDINSEKTDPRPLALAEVFPSDTIELGGRTYRRDRTSINHQCELAARGGMALALDRGRCRSVVRVTFVDSAKKLAVTSGVAVLPTKGAAVRARSSGDPSKYEWFRGLSGRRSPHIDQAGGFASSTIRGRYIIYTYVTYADGKPPKAGDRTLKTVAQQFIGYAVRPIDRRAG